MIPKVSPSGNSSSEFDVFVLWRYATHDVWCVTCHECEVARATAILARETVKMTSFEDPKVRMHKSPNQKACKNEKLAPEIDQRNFPYC